MNKKNIYRIIDANLNRAREGIRVTEEVARLYLNDKKLTQRLKSLRHKIDQIAQKDFDSRQLILYRDSQHDVGAFGMGKLEGKREGTRGIVQANLRRSQEALRVLEEFGKLISLTAACSFKKIRFALYSLEKDILNSL